MKKLASAILILLILCGGALAAGSGSIGDFLEANGFPPRAADGDIAPDSCHFVQDSGGCSITWSDDSGAHAVSTIRYHAAMMKLYPEVLGMRAWDSCTFAIDGKTRFAYNARGVKASKICKSLPSYISAVEAYAREQTATPTPAPTAKPKKESKSSGSKRSYVLNTHTKKFHYPSCRDVKKIKSSNRKDVTSSREDIVRKGYSPCGHCNP